MKGTKGVRYVLLLAVVLSAPIVQAQGSDTEAASASSAPNAKEIRVANRLLRKAVLRTLSRTKGLNVDRVVVVAKGGAILLEGYVPENNQIDLATSAAQAVPGVATVTNRLIVRAEGH
ncbi:BON domain-containing protein [Paraburkholderia acidicola]|uniref:BON domain-containing protein n=1 Tax=Paraburkholderia acidicola TaxID=1912599 RepID=A0ABV1LLU3_9BURK